MAGPYAKRLDALAALISFFASVGAAISRPVPASVAPNRFRLQCHRQGEHSAGDGGKEKRTHDERRSDDGADGRHELHVTCARSTEPWPGSMSTNPP